MKYLLDVNKPVVVVSFAQGLTRAFFRQHNNISPLLKLQWASTIHSNIQILYESMSITLRYLYVHR